MREIEVSMLTDVIEKLCIEANEHLPSEDVYKRQGGSDRLRAEG